MSKRVRVGLLGLGTVGAGVVRIVNRNADLIEGRVGASLEVVRAAVRNPLKDRGVEFSADILTTDPHEVVRDPEVDVVVELIGGTDPARQLVLEAIAEGKHVVTANKALMAEHGAEICQAAERRGVSLGIEASVAGGIPVIKTLRESLAANRIVSVYGIINGTSNYILTKMSQEDRLFGDILREAQDAGYAESDPSFDIGGIDAAHKLCILVHLAFGVRVELADIYIEGISDVSPVDIEFGRELGYTLKPLAIAKSSNDEIEIRVHPTFVPDDSPIAQVGGVYNAIQIVGDAVGDLMLQGKGAGEMPTASAVVSDIIDVARDMASGGSGSRFSGPSQSDNAAGRIKPIEAITSLYYLRFMVDDTPGVLSQISGSLGQNNISIGSVIQKGRKEGGTVPLVIMTHTAMEQDIRRALQEIGLLSCVAREVVLIRVESASD